MFKIAIRHLVKNKLHSFISIFGLAVGLSACLLISMHVFHELSYDQFHTKKDRIYRVNAKLDFNGEIDAALTSLALGPTLKNDYPEVENFVRFRNIGTPALQRDQEIFNNIRMAQTDSTIFDILDIPLLIGDPKLALSTPKSIVISQQTAQKLFGDEDPMNQNLQMGGLSLIVTGIMADPPENTEFQFDAYLQLNKGVMPQWEAFMQDWFRIGFNTFILLPEGYDESMMDEKMAQFEQKYVQPWAASAGLTAGIEYSLTSLAKLHFDNSKQYDSPKGNPTYLLVFSLLAVFILLIASINFVNLSLAQSSKRAKEIGVRKTLGVSLWGLQRQFLTESTLVSLLSLVLSLALVEMLIPAFNVLTGKTFALTQLLHPASLFVMLALVVIIGVGAGSYPAFVLSRLEANHALRGGVGSLGKIGVFRKILLFVQFAFSLFMITGTFLISDQMHYMANKDLGFDKENILTLNMPNDQEVISNAATILTELRKIQGVTAVSQGAIPTGSTGQLLFRVEQEGVLEEHTLKFIPVEERFVDLMGIQIKEGRNFSKEIATDQQKAFIVNETAAKQFGWGEKILGRRMQWGLEANDSAANDGVVVGVMGDFNFNSLHTPLDPLVLIYQPNWVQRQITLRLEKGDYATALVDIEKTWDSFAKGHLFNYQFFEDGLAQNYVQEERMQKVFNYFSTVSILLALLGLFAVISFAVENRTKEIGVRKILGADTIQISWLVARDFIYAICIAFLITAPFNYYFMQKWLLGFAYKTPIQMSSFLIAFGAGIILSLLIVFFHAIKIARSNPINSLRYE